MGPIAATEGPRYGKSSCDRPETRWGPSPIAATEGPRYGKAGH
jgi:hypothetical protein